MRAAKRLRTNKLPNPGLQLRLTLALVGMAGAGMCLQFLFLTSTLSDLAPQLTADPVHNYSLLFEASLRVLLWTLLLALPLIVVAGILRTFRIVGPIYRLTRFLESIERGERVPDCELRKGDELLDFCALLNRVTAPLRAVHQAESAAPDEVDEAA